MKYLMLMLLWIPSAHAVDLYNLPRTPIATISQHGGNEAVFAQRVGGTLQRYSVRTGYEACADICKTPTGWVANVVSIGSHMSCSTTRNCPQGRVVSLIHSHPTEPQIVVNAVDAAVSNNRLSVGDTVLAGDPREFSEQDYTENGYLVVHGQVWFQHNKGSERLVGPVE